ncbi:heavy metal translocatin [Pisolithus marmoratus]|nr:heavy metal translocatin [Pisolithus marmoratus]
MSTTTVFLLSNLHCASCVSTIKDSLFALRPQPTAVDVSIVHQAVIVQHPVTSSSSAIRLVLEDAGFEIFYPCATTSPLDRLESNDDSLDRKRIKHAQQCSSCQQESLLPTKGITSGSRLIPSASSFSTTGDASGKDGPSGEKDNAGATRQREPDDYIPHRLSLAVNGMTCAACAASITEVVSRLPGVTQVSVNVLSDSATLVVENKDLIASVIEAIDDCGFGVELLSAEPLFSSVSVDSVAHSRTVALQIHGMFCRHCPGKVMNALNGLQPRLTVTKPVIEYTDPILEVSYQPVAPEFTLRTIISTIVSADPNVFSVSVFKPPTLEKRTRSMLKREQRAVVHRLVFTAAIAVPTFIIGVVYMSLVSSHNSTSRYFMEPIWKGNASRAQWILFFLATPVMVYGAWLFHRRSVKEIRALWRKGSTTPVLKRLTRFGSMNLLISSGVSVAYFSSVAVLVLAASQPPAVDGVGDTTTFFDSVVFLTMFLLLGKINTVRLDVGQYLQTHSKARTADALTALGSLRPAEALLLLPGTPSVPTRGSSDFGSDVEKGSGSSDNGTLSVPPGRKLEKVSIDLLEVGDVVRVLNGSSPPCDGTIVSNTETLFDESSLTGEAKLVKKKTGDQVFVGTINSSKVVDMRVDAVGGSTMLDHIVDVVREGQARRAPIERVADAVTGIFVPIVTLLAITTWVIWLSLGYSGALPRSYLDINVGGWVVWSLQFAAAVFVVACPCGIGLAAPTALLVGSGVAARHGILARGGGEAFQDMAEIDAVVFDKTGTLTEGGQPRVSDYEVIASSSKWTQGVVFGVAAEMETASTHPLAHAIRCHAETHGAANIHGIDLEEVAGLGMKAHFESLGCTAVIGSETWITQQGAEIDVSTSSTLRKWKEEGKSVVLLAVKDAASGAAEVVAVFAITDPLRSEARQVVQKLQENGIGTWIVSGDNETTAKAVAAMVGIPLSNVIAGVLPHEKAQKIEWLQHNGDKRLQSGLRKWFMRSVKSDRCVVAMVGDGINDAPALAAADVGIAIGSGSEVAISSASFILLSSNLRSLLTLADLSRKVLNRVKLNFVWAMGYNLVAVPIAAGVLYPAGHIRLPPAWASLAMALSSVSVVASSLLLKCYKQPDT